MTRASAPDLAAMRERALADGKRIARTVFAKRGNRAEAHLEEGELAAIAAFAFERGFEAACEPQSTPERMELPAVRVSPAASRLVGSIHEAVQADKVARGERPACARKSCGHSFARHQTAGGFCQHCPCVVYLEVAQDPECTCDPNDGFGLLGGGWDPSCARHGKHMEGR